MTEYDGFSKVAVSPDTAATIIAVRDGHSVVYSEHRSPEELDKMIKHAMNQYPDYCIKVFRLTEIYIPENSNA